MPILPGDKEFLNGPFKEIEGWCHDEPAWLTTHLIKVQQAENHLAPAFEIGVYKGKYLSVIHNATRPVGSEVLGFDTYEWIPIPMVERILKASIANLDGISFIPADSTKMTPPVLDSHLGGRKAGFISVDGAHTPDAVASDLALCEAVLAPWGIVAIDDFLNPMALGVTEGIMRFWHNATTNLAPFCFCGGKLFAAHREMAEHYSEQCLPFFEENRHLPNVNLMIQNKVLHGLAMVKQNLLGQPVWIVT